MKIFFDLDGTLLDSKLRLYKLFQFLVPESNFTFENYWELKQNKNAHKDILINYFHYTENKIQNFIYQWMTLIESAEWIKLDTIFDGVHTHLLNLKKQHELFIITNRQFDSVVIQQIQYFGLKDMFNDVLVTHQNITKQNLIKSKCIINSTDWIIGDTGNDIITGKDLNINTAAVLSGFMNKENLEKYHPNILLNNICEFNI